MTEPLDLEPIKARLDLVPHKFPWGAAAVPAAEGLGHADRVRVFLPYASRRLVEYDGSMEAGAGDFVRHAATDIAALIVEVERLRFLVEDLGGEWESGKDPRIPR